MGRKRRVKSFHELLKEEGTDDPKIARLILAHHFEVAPYWVEWAKRVLSKHMAEMSEALEQPARATL